MTSATVGSTGKKYQWLEVMRGLAAVWVLLHHAYLTTNAFNGPMEQQFVARGNLGVDFFFILSGFIITFSVSRMLGSGRGASEYVLARMFRIYIPYLPIGVSLYFAYQLFPDISAGGRDIGLMTSATLFPTVEDTALSVAWTLKHELLFYLLFGTVFISPTFGKAVLGSWFAFVILSFLTETQYLSPLLVVAASPLNLWFLLGIVVFALPENSLAPRSWAFLLAGLCLFLYWVTSIGASRLIVGLVLGSLVYLMTRTPGISRGPSKAFLLLGAASYSIYLVHNPVQSMIARIPLTLQVDLSVNTFFAFVAIGSLLAGIAYYYIVEAQGIRGAKALLSARFPRDTASVAAKEAKESA